jgi:hypothetical protein
MTSATEFISEYNGSNSFLNSVKSGYSKYGRLTPAQSAAVIKIVKSMKEKVKSMAPIEVRKNIEQIMEYKGNNKFIKDLQEKYEKYGKLTEKQIDAGLKSINRKPQNTVKEPMKLPKNQTIRIRQYIAKQIKEDKDLNFLPIQIEVSHLIGASRKALHLRGKMSTEVTTECRCCGRGLKDEMSIATGMGKTCSKNMGVEYAKNQSDVDRFKEDLQKKVDEVGVFDFWVPKSQVSEWDGVYKLAVNSQFQTYVNS